MKKAIIDVPAADYKFFEQVMSVNLWPFEWANDGEEYPEDGD